MTPDKSNKAPTYAYKIKNSIYINTTSSCSNVCEFCIKFFARGVEGHNLIIPSDPTVEQACEQLDRLIDAQTASIVFCGLGESTYRVDFMEQLAAIYRPRGFKFRLNTNGHGNLINKCDITSRLSKFLDSISISLNAQNPELYDKLCNPAFENSYEAMLEFARLCRGKFREVYLTVVDLPGVDTDECKKIAESVGAIFRIRPHIPHEKENCDCVGAK